MNNRNYFYPSVTNYAGEGLYAYISSLPKTHLEYIDETANDRLNAFLEVFKNVSRVTSNDKKKEDIITYNIKLQFKNYE